MACGAKLNTHTQPAHHSAEVAKATPRTEGKSDAYKVVLFAVGMLALAGLVFGLQQICVQHHAATVKNFNTFSHKLRTGWHSHSIGNKIGGLSKNLKWMKGLNNGTNVGIMTATTAVGLGTLYGIYRGGKVLKSCCEDSKLLGTCKPTQSVPRERADYLT